MRSRRRMRGLVFAVILTASLASAAAYVAVAALRGGQAASPQGPSAAFVAKRPHLVFLRVDERAGGARDARVTRAALDDHARRSLTPVACQRVHFASGRGLCLVPDHGPFRSAYSARVTDARFETRHEIELTGLPSRARVSPDGRYGAVTAFVTGHSYAQDTFSTQTLLIDMARGAVLADLEQDFAVVRGGQRFKEVDFNFWGVTFARDSNRFYATLRTRGKTYLIEGDVASRRARVLRENVECPSISPDNTRLAYKKLVGGRWRLHVLDLRSMVETPLADTDGVDDQVEWLDDRHVLYAFSPPPAIWIVPADGSRAPRKFLTGGLSPAVVRR